MSFFCRIFASNQYKKGNKNLGFSASMYWLFPRNFPERLMGKIGKVGVKNRLSLYFSEGNLSTKETAILVIFSIGTSILGSQ